MQHFFMLAESRKEIGGKLEEANQLYERAAHLAALVAPYRHPKYSTIKLQGDRGNPLLTGNATSRELRGEIVKHLIRLAPVLELDTVPELQGSVFAEIAEIAKRERSSCG